MFVNWRGSFRDFLLERVQSFWMSCLKGPALGCFGVWVLLCQMTAHADDPLRVAYFEVDASPRIGSPMAYDPATEIEVPLSCRGIVILGADEPIVLCAVDWLGIANEAHQQFRQALATAASTSAQRVAVHTLHQHDAPRCDGTAVQLLAEFGLVDAFYDPILWREVMQRAGQAIRAAIPQAQAVTHLGLGKGTVEKVASNRRILGDDGKVQHVRYTATRDPKIRAFPAGTIDPVLKCISLWNHDTPLVALTYYATHPQSYYRTGKANPDFPGLARNQRTESTGVAHVHFNGAGGNIGAGKWNDGSPANRQRLADRVAQGMKWAWESTVRVPIKSDEISFDSLPVHLPPGDHLVEARLIKQLEDHSSKPLDRLGAARHLGFLRRCEAQLPIDVSCLRLKSARILHLPGELFVEYQLYAQNARPDLFVAMAAYGDYGPGYIGTAIAYDQGGYETSDRASRVSPAVEKVLRDAIDSLLETPRN